MYGSTDTPNERRASMPHAELTEREELLEIIRNVYKTAYGINPQGIYHSYSVEELKDELDKLSKIADEVLAKEEQAFVEAGKTFESFITRMMSDHSIDRITAIRWDMDALDIPTAKIGPSELDAYAYHHQLKYDYFDDDFPEAYSRNNQSSLGP